MSFKSIQISYVPPLTVPAPLRAQVTAAPSAAEALLLSSVQTQTIAGQISAGLDGLNATSTYLQQIILTICAGSGVVLDPQVSPEVLAALGRIYNTPVPPAGITVEMYANMLDAQLALMQMDMALGNAAADEASPYQTADLITATMAFEDAMIDSLGYQNNLAPKLRALKGDQAICQNLQEGLAAYPAVAGTSSTLPTGLDMSSAVSSIFGNFITNQCASYAGLFKMLTSPGSIEGDLVAITAALLGQTGSNSSGQTVPPVPTLSLPQVTPLTPIASLGLPATAGASSGSGSGPSLAPVNAALSQASAITSSATAIAAQATALESEICSVMSGFSTSFSVLLSGSHGPSAKTLAHDLTNFMFVRLISEVGCMCMLMDRVVGLAVAPIKNELGAVTQLLHQVQILGDQLGHIATGPLKGMVKGGTCSKKQVPKGAPKSPAASQNQSAWDAAFGKGNKGVKSLVTHLDQAMRWINHKFQQMQTSLRKLMNRRSNDANEYLQLMCSIQALESLISLTLAIASQADQIATQITGQAPLAALTGVLSSISSPTGSSYAIQGNSLVVTPPTVPPVPPSALPTLNAGGAGLTTSQSLSTVSIGVSSVNANA